MSEFVELVFVRIKGYPVSINQNSTHKSNEYIDRNYLYRAPAWSHLEKGDLVLCRIGKALTQAKVVASDNVEIGGEKFNTWVDIANADLPLPKIDGVFKPFKYKDEGGILE